MFGIKTVLMSGFLTLAVLPQAREPLSTLIHDINLSNGSMSSLSQVGVESAPQIQLTYHDNGQIKKEVIFNSSDVRIFRTFDSQGIQLFDQADESNCAQ